MAASTSSSSSLPTTTAAAPSNAPPPLATGNAGDEQEDAPRAGKEWRSAINIRAFGQKVSGVTETLLDVTKVDPAACLTHHDEESLLVVTSQRRPTSSLVFVRVDGEAPSYDVGLTMAGTMGLEGPAFSVSYVGDVLAVAGTNQIKLYKAKAANLSRGRGARVDLDLMETFQSRPDDSARSVRTSCVALSRHDPSTFLTTEQASLSLWSVEAASAPISSIKASSKALTSAAWAPHNGGLCAASSVSGSVKVWDSRTLGSAANVAVRMMQAAHASRVNEVAWSPFVPHWLSSCGDDGCIHVWDLRFPSGPACTLTGPSAPVTTVAWSHAHAEVLGSGGLDRRVVLSSMALVPHHTMYIQDEPLATPVRKVLWSERWPSCCYGLSGGGDLVALTPTPAFLTGVPPSRFRSSAIAERDLEEAVYQRDLARSLGGITDMAARYNRRKKVAEATVLLDMYEVRKVSNNWIDGPPPPSASSFETQLREYTMFIPPNFKACMAIQPDREAQLGVSEVTLSMRVGNLIKARAPDELYELRREMLDHAESLGGLLLTQALQVLMGDYYLAALELAIRIGRVFQEGKMFQDFESIAHLVLYPTVLDTGGSSAPPATAAAAGSAAVPSSSVAKASASGGGDGGGGGGGAGGGAKGKSSLPPSFLEDTVVNLSGLNATEHSFYLNSSLCIPQIQLLRDVTRALTQPKPASAIIKAVTAFQLADIVSINILTIYLHALMRGSRFGKLCVDSVTLATMYKGVPFGSYVDSNLKTVYAEKMNEYCLLKAKTEDPDAIAVALLNCLEAMYNCAPPEAIKTRLPMWFETLAHAMDTTLERMCVEGKEQGEQEAFAIADELISDIKGITKERILKNPFDALTKGLITNLSSFS